MSRFQETFNEELASELQKELEVKNRFAIPVLKKIVINSGIGRIPKENKAIESVIEQLSLITGQKPIITKAKKAISSFKIREGASVGLKVTLRDKRMYDFLERMIKVVMPRTRDFDGIPEKSISETGILTIGFKDVEAFPETSHQQKKIEYSFGLEVTMVPKCKNREEALLLYKKIGLIFKKNK
jgi:large subunit ribosomal protein L5